MVAAPGIVDVLDQTIAGLIETYRQGFLTLDPAKLASIWDSFHSPLVYIAQERPEPILGWPRIERYFEELPCHLDKVSAMEVEQLATDRVGEDVIVAFFTFRCTALLRGRTEAFEPTGRVTMVFRRTDDMWRAVHYHESALAHRAATA